MPLWESLGLEIDVDLAVGFVLPYDLLPEQSKAWEKRVASEEIKREIRKGGARFYAKSSGPRGNPGKDLRYTLNIEPLTNSIPGFKKVLVILKVRKLMTIATLKL